MAHPCFLANTTLSFLRKAAAGSRNLRLRGWLGFAAAALALSLVAANVWLLRAWLESRHLADDLQNAQSLLEGQRRQMVHLAGRITGVSRDLERVQRFDSKLRIMMNMEKDPQDAGGGMDRPGDFSRLYLPLHRQELAARKMQDFLDRLSESTRLEEVRQQDLLLALRENREAFPPCPPSGPWWALYPPVSAGAPRLSAARGQFHKGLDITNRVGTPW